MTEWVFPDLELCAENYRAVKLAEKFGIKRIELCSALSVGGLTPGTGLVRQCADRGKVEIHTMIRHREGNFQYSRTEVGIMQKEVLAMKRAGATGVVFGCLDRHAQIDHRACEQLVNTARDLELEITFHRAFDFCRQAFDAIDVLIETGFDRVLTSGQQNTALEGIELIRKLVSYASGRIQIMAGSGINPHNAKLLAATGVNALHFTAHKPSGPTLDGMGETRRADTEKIRGIVEALKGNA